VPPCSYEIKVTLTEDGYGTAAGAQREREQTAAATVAKLAAAAKREEDAAREEEYMARMEAKVAAAAKYAKAKNDATLTQEQRSESIARTKLALSKPVAQLSLELAAELDKSIKYDEKRDGQVLRAVLKAMANPHIKPFEGEYYSFESIFTNLIDYRTIVSTANSLWNLADQGHVVAMEMREEDKKQYGECQVDVFNHLFMATGLEPKDTGPSSPAANCRYVPLLPLRCYAATLLLPLPPPQLLLTPRSLLLLLLLNYYYYYLLTRSPPHSAAWWGFLPRSSSTSSSRITSWRRTASSRPSTSTTSTTTP